MTQADNKLFLDHIFPDLNAHNIKQAYQSLCQKAGEVTGQNPATIYDLLMECENNQTSGIGDGVAIPHLSLEGTQKSFMGFARLQQPIDFNALDTHPVDLVFLLISPKKDGPRHLSRLSGITRLFRSAQFLRQLRETKDQDVLQALFLDPQTRLLAA